MDKNTHGILIVDDEPHVCQLLARWFDREGYRCRMATNGPDALRLLEQESYSLLIADIAMPGMSGLELQEVAKKRFPDLAVIVITGLDDREVATQALRLGAYAYLFKPCERNEMLINVENALRLRDLECENRLHRAELERLVQARTVELESTNDKLRQEIEERKRTEISLDAALQDSSRMAADLEKAYNDLKASHDQILQQEKMASVGQLSAGIAHEINNPTGFIQSNLNSLARYLDKLSEFCSAQAGILDAATIDAAAKASLLELRHKLKIDFILQDIKNLIGESLEGTERIQKIVQGLKGFSRKDQNVRSAANLNDCLESTLNVVWNELKYKCQIHRDYGDLPPLQCYPQQLSQVFMNLLVNAAQSIDCHGDISITTWADNDAILVRIADTGSGIPQENIKKIFDPFFTTKEVGKGTGLGLSIVADIVRGHLGEITVESELGKGTAFTIRLPLHETAPPSNGEGDGSSS